MPGEGVQEGIGPRIVRLAHGAIDGDGGEDPEEAQLWIAVAFQGVMQVQCGVMLRRKHSLKLFPCQVHEHRILEDTGRMDESDQTPIHALQEVVHAFLGAHVHLVLLHLHANLGRLDLDLLPQAKIHIADFRRPRQELDRKACNTLCNRLVHKPVAHHQTQRAVASGNCDDALSWNGEILACSLVLLRAHLSLHIAAALEYAHGIVAKADDAEGLRSKSGPNG
mmetsp:Transcript_10920/g.17413  ORF Transcript_10920/g.17413 Transcript_10920/m.17413 type:complete len:223 (+) Transcript_10920:537-1205(+)